jgi:transcriptional regulator with AAA-type ATPase domain
MSDPSTCTFVVPVGAADGEAHSAVGRGPIGFTLCFHPELDRIGEHAPLAPTEALAIDRESPRFRQPGAPATLGRGLATSFVSQRLPFRVEALEDGGVRVHPPSDPRHATLHLPERAAEPCTSELSIAEAELDAGVVLLLNRSVVLLLHRLPPDPESCDAADLLQDTRALLADARALAKEAGDAAHGELIARAEKVLRSASPGEAALFARTADLVRELAALRTDADVPSRAALARAASRLTRRCARLDRIQHGVIGESRALQRLWEQIYALDRAGPIALLGEQGAGKSDVARAIARFSLRSERFEYKNAANLIASVAAAELFGRRKGFLGPDDDGLPGIFRTAHRGTLFLDEIGELPPEVQPKLLDAVERGFVTPLGEQEVAVDVLLVTATNADLTAARFKSDLRDRLFGVQLRVPSLRERREDIPRLLLHFLRERWGGQLQRAPESRDERARWAAGWARFMVQLLADPWPGNVRTLRDTARRLALANPLAIDPDDAVFVEPTLPATAPASEPVAVPPAAGGDKSAWKALLALSEGEQHAQLAALLTRHGSQLKAAVALGVSGPTLNRQCKKLGLDVANLNDAQLASPPEWANAKAVSTERNDRMRARQTRSPVDRDKPGR